MMPYQQLQQPRHNRPDDHIGQRSRRTVRDRVLLAKKAREKRCNQARLDLRVNGMVIIVRVVCPGAGMLTHGMGGQLHHSVYRDEKERTTTERQDRADFARPNHRTCRACSCQQTLENAIGQQRKGRRRDGKHEDSEADLILGRMPRHKERAYPHRSGCLVHKDRQDDHDTQRHIRALH